MTRASSFAPAAAAVLSFLVPAADASAAKTKRPCSEPGTTIERTVEARVYEKRRGDDHYLMGCHYRTNKRRILDSWFSCDCSIGDAAPARVLAMTGRHVAVADSHGCDPTALTCGPPGLRVLDTRSGAVKHVVPGGGGSSGLLLKRNGSLAFVLGDRLTRMDSAGTAVLDEGPGVDPASLAATTTRLYWMSGGTPRTAPFS